MAESEVKPSPETAISELQEAFGSLLTARKEKIDIIDRPSIIEIYRRSQPDYVPPEPPVIYKWTGTFELFSFPRELRDRIYFHYLHRPKGVRYIRNPGSRWPFNDDPEPITDLFLTSKQVYDEAYQVFCRYNQVVFGSLNCAKSVQGTLRLFPDRPASMIQRICTEYSRPSRYYGWSQHNVPPLTLAEKWVTMLRDAHTFKAFFPRLREYTASWHATALDFEEKQGMKFEKKTEEEKVALWLSFMRRALERENVVPPMWLKFKLQNTYPYNWSMDVHEDAMNEAYMILWREAAPLRKAEKELDDSGKKWIEEQSVVKGRKKRRQNRHLNGVP